MAGEISRPAARSKEVSASPEAEAELEVTSAGPAPATCPACEQPVDPLRARHLAVVEGRVVPYCSEPCRAAGPRPRPPTLEDVAPQAARRALRGLLAATPFVAALGLLLGIRISVYWRGAAAATEAAAPRAAAHAAVAAAPVRPYVDTGPEYGPPPPPPFIESDRWVHPLPGPTRRLPERPSRRFGAGRDHDSPDSCGGGHCGVDIGEAGGEPVLAVHDGIVERVVRVEGADRGGRYVRLLHQGGHVVTQYMHLGRVSEELAAGSRVRAGDVLGTVGDSGTHNSGPHLHFTFATRAIEGGPEAYVDPLALLTVWPLQ